MSGQRRRGSTLFGTTVLICLLGCALASISFASRAPSKGEKRQIQKAAVTDCRDRGEQRCRPAAVRISTANERYAFGGAAGRNYYNGALLKRIGSSKRWQVLTIQGGGAVACSTWTRFAPPEALTDLGIEGLSKDNASFGPCHGGRFVFGTPCAGNGGPVTGTGGIYSLRAKGTGCDQAREIVRLYHQQRAQLGGESQTVSGYACTGSYTENFEGLQVRCDGPSGQRVSWTAYLAV